MKLILQITLGVSFGIVLGGAILITLTGSLLTQLIKQPVVNPPVVTLPVLPAPAIVQPAIQPEPSPPIAPVDTRTTEEIQMQQQQLAAHEEKLKKDALFKSWYKKPQECYSPNDNHAILVKCGNDHIRARAKFDELYQQGKF
ncbi:MAG: hypothetical protein CG439_2431 [Methylococcaceae bacterium NSP1-2]|nr:hypothetical protein [Methylococcaceae bacterium]OYV15670.1 MAG: hypothetical protein CG439_2431 [Methylococcaceae bacterium NSP1-2]